MSRSRNNVPRVLVVDDEPDLRELLELTLIKMGLEVSSAASIEQAIKLLDQGNIDLCLTDMRLGNSGSGLDVVRHIATSNLDVPVAVITAFGSLDGAVEVLKAGAFDYLAKPVSLDQLRTLVRSALRLERPAPKLGAKDEDKVFIGESEAIQAALGLIDRVAKSHAPVYLTGESGSGKERAARLIHSKSSRAAKEFVPVNCGAIPENLMESEFFGYKKGAFTGADSERDGFFQVADGGTLFLDEVADLPLSMQVKLLRVIQEKRVRKVGDTREIPLDVRIICATHQNLAKCVDEGRFRQDLYYRLNVIEVRMPSLRDMRDDIPTIARGLLARLTQQNGMHEPRLAADALASLTAYDFPGNVRELENILERALALCDGKVISADDLQLKRNDNDEDRLERGPGDKCPLQEYLDQLEKAAILEALDKTRFNRTQAAKLLGVTFRSLRYRMERLSIS